MKKLLIITLNWPAPNYSAAGIRLMQLVEFFKEKEYQITLASTADIATANSYDFGEVVLASIQLNHCSFDEFIKESGPDLVLFDRFMSEEQFGWRVAEFAPNAIRILDTEDLHSLRKSREDALKKNRPWSSDIWLDHDMTKREVASILRCDLSLIISSYEMDLLESLLPNHEQLFLHLPFMVDAITQEEVKHWPAFEERKDFVFIGFGGHAPNIDAIVHLQQIIWPLIRKKLPDAKIHIYGGNLPEKIYRLHNGKEGFLVHGWVENVRNVIASARVMLAPLRFGAGLKGKLIDAMNYGTPSVTTAIGAEGMQHDMNWNGKICDDPMDFAKAAVEIHQDQAEWEQAQQNGIKIIDSLFNKKKLSDELSQKLEWIHENLAQHRAKNFIGGLLQHQILASTKYMAKWIEEKNKTK